MVVSTMMYPLSYPLGQRESRPRLTQGWQD
jgi:hypothetical protein